MRMYLAGGITSKQLELFKELKVKYYLDTFWEISNNKKQKNLDYVLYKNSKDLFMLDSGAFTFTTSGANVEFENYLNKYIKFIKDHDIKRFFELDIDVIIGLDKVIEFTKYLEKETKRQCIPVWHKSRGLEYWKKLITDYKYISIGGLTAKRGINPQKSIAVLNYLIDMAHAKNCKVHGLGLTPPNVLDFHFDSVDSTTWCTTSRYGYVLIWQPIKKEVISIKPPKGYRNKIPRLEKFRTGLYAFNQWAKYVDKE